MGRRGLRCHFPENEHEWEVLGRLIGEHTQLKTVQIEFMSWIDGAPEEFTAKPLLSFCRGICQNRSIQSFAFQYSPFNMFETGILQELAPFIEHNYNLSELNLSCSSLCSRGTGFLSSVLMKRSDKSLTKIDLVGTNYQDDGRSLNGLLNALKGYSGLNTLGLRGYHIGQNDFSPLASILNAPQSQLRKIGLSGNGADNYSLEMLELSLSKNNGLEVLELNHNPSITTTGWTPLLRLLRHDKCKLKVLNLSSNMSINDEVAHELVASLTNNQTLTMLNLGRCHSVTTTGFKSITNLLSIQGSKLKTLHLRANANAINDDFAAELATSLANNQTLECLNLARNSAITSVGYSHLGRVLGNPQIMLRKLYMYENTIDDDTMISFSTALATNRRLTELMFLTENGTVTSTGWSALSKTLCDPTTISSIYNSNHVMTSIHIRGMPETVKAYLDFNRISLLMYLVPSNGH